MSKPLLQRNSRILLIWLPVVLLISSGLFYIMLTKHAHHTQEKLLLLKQHNVWAAFTASSGILEKRVRGEYEIVQSEAGSPVILDSPRDTTIYYPDQKKNLPFQVLTSRLQLNGHFYFISTYISSIEITHLIIKVFATEAVILFLLLLTIIVLSRKSSGWLWQPFFSTISAAENFDIVCNNQLKLEAETGTSEFDRLNKVLAKLVDDVNTAYHNQKQFVENASHEIQTPLAIIRAKLELLINEPNITEKEALLLSDVTNAANRLSEMNKTLLLLAKIENKQFPDTAPVNVSTLVKEIVDDCRNYNDECPEIASNIADNVTINVNPSLIEILIMNLVKNAIVHNSGEGKVNVLVKDHYFIIENTGEPPLTPTDTLFERFKKSSHKKKTTGLGLAIAKQISQLYNFRISYTYQNGWHRVEVIF